MFSRTLPLLALPAAAVVSLALAGCGSSAPQSQPAAGTSAAVAADATSAGAYTASQLRGALLTRINGAGPALPAEYGEYGELPQVKATKKSMQGVVVSPASCEAATFTGFNSTTFAHTPAAVATFRVGRNGVSEVLMAPSASVASQALGSGVPVGCAHYHATVNGKSFSYEVHESGVSGIGTQARAVNVAAIGYPQVDVWSLVFRGGNVVGAITVIGPNASKAAVRQLAGQAYSYASTRLG